MWRRGGEAVLWRDVAENSATEACGGGWERRCGGMLRRTVLRRRAGEDGGGAVEGCCGEQSYGGGAVEGCCGGVLGRTEACCGGGVAQNGAAEAVLRSRAMMLGARSRAVGAWGRARSRNLRRDRTRLDMQRHSCTTSVNVGDCQRGIHPGERGIHSGGAAWCERFYSPDLGMFYRTMS